MTLSKYERETIVNFNEGDEFASVYTHNKKLLRKLSEYAENSPDCRLKKVGEGFAEYSIPKRWVKVRMPRLRTEEQRREQSERARANLSKAREARVISNGAK